jgi:hypothetical protein
MGYTHYWHSRPLEAERAELAGKRYRKFGIPALEQVFAWHRGLLVRSYQEGNLSPRADEEAVAFNGVGESAHEDLYLSIPELLSSGCRDFCKTNLKPYDLAVCDALLILAWCRPGLELASDGFRLERGRKWAGESWPEAVKGISEILGEPVLPALGFPFCVDAD